MESTTESRYRKAQENLTAAIAANDAFLAAFYRTLTEDLRQRLCRQGTAR